MARKSEVMTARGAAQRLGVTIKYIYDLLYTQKLAARKIRGQWQVSAKAVEDRLRRRGE